MPRISVIIPTWNRVEDTQRAVGSVLRQTFQDFEILVADDGSTDSTPEAFEHFPDQRLRYIRVDHSGLPAVPRNAALAQARGELIAFLDGDDEWLPQKLSRQIQVLDQHPDVGLVCTNGYLQKGYRHLFPPLFHKTPILIKDSLVALVTYSNFVMNSSVLVRRNVLKETGGFSEEPSLRALEDFDLWLRVGLTSQIVYLNRPLIHYYDHSTDSVRSEVSNLKYMQNMLSIYEHVLWMAKERERLTPELESLLVQRIYHYRRELGQWQAPVCAPGEVGLPPVISVVLPVYNGETYIRESVFSILSQSFPSLELIVINDGSTDRTGELLASIDDTRVRVITQDNQGLVASLNKGFRLARGRYIARQDHDDLAFPTRFEKQVEYLEAHPDVGLLGTCAEIWVDNQPTRRELRFPADDLALRCHLLFDNPFVHSSVMIRKEAIPPAAEAYLPEFASSALEDYELWSRISDRSKIANLTQVLQVYREVSTSISRKPRDNFAFRERVALRNFAKYGVEISNPASFRYLLSLASPGLPGACQPVPFRQCRETYRQCVAGILGWVGQKGAPWPGDFQLSINELSWKHFAQTIHFPRWILHRVDQRLGYPLIALLEKWEAEHPGGFQNFGQFTRGLYAWFRPPLQWMKQFARTLIRMVR